MVRLDRIICNLGLTTRGKLRPFLAKNRVLVNGRPFHKISDHVNPLHITINGEPLAHPYPLYIMLHKPRGYVCSSEHDIVGETKIVYDLLPEKWIERRPPLTCAGRLDKWASGLVVLSQDGDLVYRITSPKKKKGVMGKVYEIQLIHDLNGEEVKLFSSGELKLKSEDKPCKPAKFEIIDIPEKLVRITMYEGRYHQVRRMLAACGNRAVSIKRVATGPLQIGDLPVGHWRELTREELKLLETEDPRPFIEAERGGSKSVGPRTKVVEEGFNEDELEEL